MKKYTEQELRKLVDLIDEAYRPNTKDNVKGYYILEDFLENGFKKKEEEKIPFTYFSLRQKLSWDEFCDLTGTTYYAMNGRFSIKDDEIFRIEKSKALRFNLL